MAKNHIKKSPKRLKLRLKQWREFGAKLNPYFENEYYFGNENGVFYKDHITFTKIKNKRAITSRNYLFSQWPYKNRIVYIKHLRVVV